jgi:hypothetical protein
LDKEKKMSHPFASSAPLSGGLGLSIEDIFGGSSTDGDQPETWLDFAKFAVGTAGEYLTTKQREEAAKAEAESLRIQRQMMAEMMAAQEAAESPEKKAEIPWVPIGIGVAAVAGIIIYMTMKG